MPERLLKIPTREALRTVELTNAALLVLDVDFLIDDSTLDKIPERLNH